MVLNAEWNPLIIPFIRNELSFNEKICWYKLKVLSRKKYLNHFLLSLWSTFAWNCFATNTLSDNAQSKRITILFVHNKNAPKQNESTGMYFIRQAATHLKNLIITSKSIGGTICRVSKLSVTELADFAFFKAWLLANAMYDWIWVSSTGGGVSRLKHSQLQLNIWWQRPSKFWVTQLQYRWWRLSFLKDKRSLSFLKLKSKLLIISLIKWIQVLLQYSR